MFEKILIVYSEKMTKKHLGAIDKVKKIVDGRKFETIKSEELKEKHFENIELAITIGGDGTFIKTASFLQDSPIIGINSEPEFSEGALKSLKEHEIHKLKEVLDGKFKIIERQRAKVYRNKTEVKELALNEVYVGSLSQFHTSRYIIKLDGHSEEQRSSGVLVVTGSGSTAWYKSAGGKPFHFGEKKLKFIVREPFVGRIFQPKLLHGEITDGKKISFESKRPYGGVIAIDANSIHDFNNNDVIEIELTDMPLKVLEAE